MSSRSGGSTGVIVALVVFVVLTLGLLVTSIFLYKYKTEAELASSEAKTELDLFISSPERGGSDVATVRAAAGGNSVFGYMLDQSREMGQFVANDRNADIARMRTTLGLAENQSVQDAMRALRQERDARAQEANSQKSKAADLAKEIDSLKQRLASAEQAREEAVAKITGSIAGYRDAAEGYRAEISEAKDALAEARSEHEEIYTEKIDGLLNEIDALRERLQRADERVAALQRKVDATTISATNPAALVDARIVDYDAKNGAVFIDIGANKRVVPGMTFEVFDDAPSIVSAAKGNGRGKASIQVIKIGDTTSTCRILRGSGSRPIVKDDVIANAVYNPNYKFKFLVHGKFDVNGDGKASVGEADFIKNRIMEWGGEVLERDTLSGDLDFLVLGVEPPMPSPLTGDATDAQIIAYTQQNNARELYDSLLRAATDAEIPVLNWTRFQTLTGSVPQ
ncbi:MAG: hypothetical protein RL136_527 [Planctomycetota bacterium]|jgi:uncharacterized protein YlxW (UPF0749 family)